MYGKGIFFMEKDKVRLWMESMRDAEVRIYFIEYEKTRYGCGFVSMKMLK